MRRNLSSRRNHPSEFRCVWFIFVGLAAACVGCQSIPAADRSSVISNDLPLPALPPAEADDDSDGDPEARGGF